MRIIWLCSLIAFFTPYLNAQPAENLVKVKNTKKFGSILTNNKGMTLYVFTPDSEQRKSTCYEECAKIWPPLLSPEGPEGYSLDLEFSNVKRDDNTLQVAYKGSPLYTYFKDKKPGDTKGHGLQNKWSVAKFRHTRR
jgi:predicted lipoprotein with Yx(FWY)xxD motif